MNCWKAEALKQEEYVELGRLAVDRLRGEIEILNMRLCNFKNVSTIPLWHGGISQKLTMQAIETGRGLGLCLELIEVISDRRLFTEIFIE